MPLFGTQPSHSTFVTRHPSTGFLSGTTADLHYVRKRYRPIFVDRRCPRWQSESPGRVAWWTRRAWEWPFSPSRRVQSFGKIAVHLQMFYRRLNYCGMYWSNMVGRWKRLLATRFSRWSDMGRSVRVHILHNQIHPQYVRIVEQRRRLWIFCDQDVLYVHGGAGLRSRPHPRVVAGGPVATLARKIQEVWQAKHSNIQTLHWRRTALTAPETTIRCVNSPSFDTEKTNKQK